MSRRESEAAAPERARHSRRQLLSRLGLSVGVGGAGVLALPAASVSHVEADAETGAVEPATEPVGEDETPFAVWHYRRGDDGEMQRLSPINVVFPLESATFGDVTAVCERAGLSESPLEYVRYAWDRDRERYRPQQWSAAETVVGISGRLHVRCWELAGAASLQAHLDTPAAPKHGIASYARARDAVERIFRDAGWTVADPVPLGNDKRPDHDGRASVIER